MGEVAGRGQRRRACSHSRGAARPGVIDRELDQHKGWPVIGTLAGEGAQDICNDTVEALYLTRGVEMMLQAVDELGSQARPESAGEERVAVQGEHVRQPHVAEH